MKPNPDRLAAILLFGFVAALWTSMWSGYVCMMTYDGIPHRKCMCPWEEGSTPLRMGRRNKWWCQNHTEDCKNMQLLLLRAQRGDK